MQHRLLQSNAYADGGGHSHGGQRQQQHHRSRQRQRQRQPQGLDSAHAHRADGDGDAHGDDGVLCSDAYDIMMDLTLGWHSGRLRDERVGTIAECWFGVLSPDKKKCIPLPSPPPSPSPSPSASSASDAQSRA